MREPKNVMMKTPFRFFSTAYSFLKVATFDQNQLQLKFDRVCQIFVVLDAGYRGELKFASLLLVRIDQKESYPIV